MSFCQWFQSNKQSISRSTRLAVLFIVGGINWVLGSPAVLAQQQHTALVFDIASQPLSSALVEFSQITERDILAPAALVKGKLSPKLKGNMTADEALGALLVGSGLVYSQDGRGGFRVEAEKATENGLRDETSKRGAKSEINEVIVTAQKRKENLQDVPIAITVLGGEFLDSATFSGVTEALRTIPGIDINVDQIGGGGGGALISARGVSNATRYTGPGAIAYYIDGVPYGFVRSPHYPANPNIYDLERIEFLAGPQGTLYGANALNGVLRVLTQNANPSAFEFKARTSVSATEDGGENYRGDIAFNIPVIEGKLALRAVVGYQDDSGWVDAPFGGDVNDEENQNYRLKLRAQPTDTLTMDVSAWRAKIDRGAPSLSSDDRTITAKHEQPGFDEFTSYGLSINKEFPSFSISSVTSYVDYSSRQIIDADGPLPLSAQLDSLFSSKVFSEEINLTSSLEGSWRWSAGAFYRDAEDLTYSLFAFHPPSTLAFINNDFTDTSESFAVYGEIGRRFLNDTLELSVGVRYFQDDQRTELNQQYLTTGPVAPYDSDSDAVTPRVVLTWMPVEDKTIYASYSQGFRSGFAQLPNVRSVFPGLVPVEPDKLINYEIGSKGTVWDGRASYTAAIFYIDWQDIQQSLFVEVPATGLFTSALVNGESASGLGAEFAVSAQPVDGLEISANASWNDLTLDADVVSQTPSGPVVVAREGERLVFSPEYTLGGSIAYGFPLGGTGLTGRLAFTADYRPVSILRTINGVVDSEPTFVAGASFEMETTDRWKATLYIDNLTNEDRSPTPIADDSDHEWQTRLNPRTIGIQFEYQLGRQ